MGEGEGSRKGQAPSAAWPPAAPPQDTAARRRSGPAPGELVGEEGARIEGLLGLASGLVFGFVGTSLGHPADTVKTKMQADPQFSGRSAAFVFRTTVRREGFLALYRGFIPPLIGGSCFMSAVFGSYSATFASCEGTTLMDPVFGTVRPAVVLASIAAAASRSVIETPFELVKTRLQLGQVAAPAALQSGGVLQHFRGFKVTMYRNVLLLGTMFVALDAGARLAPGIAGAQLLGPFFQGSVCNTLGWAVAWPFELLKSKVQGDTTGMLHRRSTVSMLSDVVHADGVRGMWRGFVLGGSRSFVVNGCSMVTRTHTYVCTRMRPHGRVRAGTSTRTSTQAHAHMHTHTCTHTSTHATTQNFHTYTQTRARAHTHRWLTNVSSISAVRAAPRLSSDSS
jgi:solute carrier family 25 (mitochondrial carnitine/acylcarnitine transporter), member 20/29